MTGVPRSAGAPRRGRRGTGAAVALGLLAAAPLAPRSAAGPQDAPRAAQAPPSVLLIVTDDQGYRDLGCYGALGFETPRLDALAAEGLRATDFHVSQATCTSSRASIQTGCYANRVGLEGALMPWSEVGLAPAETTLAELLRARGHRTQFIGKWHLGHQPEHRPTRHGFDHWFGLPYSNDMWPVNFDGELVGEDHWKQKYPLLPLYEDDEVVEELSTLAQQDTLTRRYTDRALAFLEEAAPTGPFFLQLCHSMPHVPLGASEPFRGSSEQGFYGDVIQEIDASTGELLDALERLGVADSTLVIFTSDNGPWLNFGDHAGSALPLREAKGTAFEGGTRVPFLARLPGVIPAGSTSDSLMATIDLLPTIAELCGGEPGPLAIDGVSQLAHWRDPDGPSARSEYLHYYNGELHAIRRGSWKLHLPHTHRTYERYPPGSGGHPGPTGTGRISNALFDLARDREERRDVSDLQPEVLAELLELAEAARAELGDGERRGSGQRAPARTP